MPALSHSEWSFLSAGGVNSKDAHELIYARQNLVTHAKAFGLDAIDMVDTNFKGKSFLKLECCYAIVLVKSNIINFLFQLQDSRLEFYD